MIQSYDGDKEDELALEVGSILDVTKQVSFTIKTIVCTIYCYIREKKTEMLTFA